MTTAPCVLPDPFHVERDDARHIAEGVVWFVKSAGEPLSLWLGPDGATMLSVNGKSPRVDLLCPFSLVGTYTAEASTQQIVDDILAMQRDPIHAS